MTSRSLELVWSAGEVSVVRAGLPLLGYLYRPDLPAELSPRPYFHPIRTLDGTVVSAVRPPDHEWHLGLSLAVPNVGGHSFWGGPTYVHGRGYEMLDDHGVITHTGFTSVPAGPEGVGFTETLEWRARSRLLLTERRRVYVCDREAQSGAWSLTLTAHLHNVSGQDLEFGSPATAGCSGSGYGGLFFRAAPILSAATAFTAEESGEAAVHGSAADWAALATTQATVVMQRDPDAADDLWFVRTTGYPGLCAALAFHKPLILPPGETVHRSHRLLIAKGALTPDAITALLSTPAT